MASTFLMSNRSLAMWWLCSAISLFLLRGRPMNCFIASTSFLYYLDGNKIQLLFNNGETKVVDLSNSLNGKVFTPLKDIEYFKRFSIKFNTIEWENGADFAPEYLYDIAS